MTNLMLIFVAALILAGAGTPLARRAALRLKIVDQPGPRKVHLNPIPLLGGLAIYGAFTAALLLFGDRFYISQLVGIFLGATLVSFFGLWDDRRGMNPLLKLSAQVVATLILILSGVQVTFVPNLPALNLFLTFLWVVGITNAMNLLDNMDGLSGGVGAIAAAFFLLLAATSGQYLVGSLTAALLGACIGFLYYNFNPASIFMGDSGSLFLGFVLAAVGIKLRFPFQHYGISWMIPVMVLGLPIFDTTLVTISRLRRKVPIYVGGKDHVSHRLVAMGLSHRQAVVASYLVCVALGLVGLLLTRAGEPDGYIIGGAVALLGLVALWILERVKWEE
ncbi:MAG: MraY family glycosyltransferase [Anaerolineae bacterium]